MTLSTLHEAPYAVLCCNLQTQGFLMGFCG